MSTEPAIQSRAASRPDLRGTDERSGPKGAVVSPARPAPSLGGGLERRVAQEAARELLTSNESNTVKALRKELEETKAIKLTDAELVDLMSELLS